MTDIRCLVGVQAWMERHVEPSALLECLCDGAELTPSSSKTFGKQAHRTTGPRGSDLTVGGPSEAPTRAPSVLAKPPAWALGRGHGGIPRVLRVACLAATMLAVTVWLAGCTAGTPDGAAPSPGGVESESESSVTDTPATHQSAGRILLVALGDSASTGHGDSAGVGWVGYYGALIQERIGRSVQVQNLAVDGMTTDRLLSMLRTSESVRAAVAAADIVTIGIGGNELNIGDAALEAGSCEGPECYVEPAKLYRSNLDAIETAVQQIADGKPQALRAVGMPNGLTGAEDVIPPFLSEVATPVGAGYARLFDQATCEVTLEHGGACVPLRDAFNGPQGTDDAYAAGLMNKVECCYPSTAGHRLIAKMLYEEGLEPVVG